MLHHEDFVQFNTADANRLYPTTCAIQPYNTSRLWTRAGSTSKAYTFPYTNTQLQQSHSHLRTAFRKHHLFACSQVSILKTRKKKKNRTLWRCFNNKYQQDGNEMLPLIPPQNFWQEVIIIIMMKMIVINLKNDLQSGLGKININVSSVKVERIRIFMHVADFLPDKVYLTARRQLDTKRYLESLPKT